jgi:hypothetical protein
MLNLKKMKTRTAENKPKRLELTRVLDNRPMKIDEISDGFCTKIREAGVEDAASERILVQNTPKDIDCHRVLIQNSR